MFHKRVITKTLKVVLVLGVEYYDDITRGLSNNTLNRGTVYLSEKSRVLYPGWSISDSFFLLSQQQQQSESLSDYTVFDRQSMEKFGQEFRSFVVVS